MSKTLQTNSTPGMGNTGLFEWMPFLPTLCRQCHSLTLRNHTLIFLELRKKAPDAGTSAHSLVWLGMVPLVTGASFRQQITAVCGPQSQKKQKLSGQQDFCRKNFPDKARKLRKFSNLRQMRVKGVLARF